jgi:hypothetical protein
MRQMLADFADPMRFQSYFGSLGVPTPMAGEFAFIVPSVATRPLRSAWIARDTPATPGPIPAFTSVTTSHPQHPRPHPAVHADVHRRSRRAGHPRGGLPRPHGRDAEDLPLRQRPGCPDTIEGLMALIPPAAFPAARARGSGASSPRWRTPRWPNASISGGSSRNHIAGN